ncbi:MAG TPA: hypothetical protein VIF43_01240 [Patescibacteria group bacterium]|jgi:hypothetical protein
MRLGRRQPEGEAVPQHERLWKPSEGLSIVDGDTRDELVAQFNGMTNRDTNPSRDYRDGVLYLGESRIEYARSADLLTGLADDDFGVFQIDALGPYAPETVRNMRFYICSEALAEAGKEDWACLLEGSHLLPGDVALPLPGKSFDPKPILPDAVEFALKEMRWHEELRKAVKERRRPTFPRPRLAV